MKQKGKCWIDAKGKEVPTYAINPVLIEEEKWAQRVLEKARKAEKALLEYVETTQTAYEKVYAAKLSDAKIKGNRENFAGMTITSFDGQIEVKITKPNVMYFDNTVTELVKEKLQSFIDSLSSASPMAVFIKDFINDMLTTSGGNLDNSKVLQLRKYRTKLAEDPKLASKSTMFIEAVDLFDKAIRTKQGSMGMYVSENKVPVKLKYTDF